MYLNIKEICADEIVWGNPVIDRYEFLLKPINIFHIPTSVLILLQDRVATVRDKSGNFRQLEHNCSKLKIRGWAS